MKHKKRYEKQRLFKKLMFEVGVYDYKTTYKMNDLLKNAIYSNDDPDQAELIRDIIENHQEIGAGV